MLHTNNFLTPGILCSIGRCSSKSPALSLDQLAHLPKSPPAQCESSADRIGIANTNAFWYEPLEPSKLSLPRSLLRLSLNDAKPHTHTHNLILNLALAGDLTWIVWLCCRSPIKVWFLAFSRAFPSDIWHCGGVGLEVAFFLITRHNLCRKFCPDMTRPPRELEQWASLPIGGNWALPPTAMQGTSLCFLVLGYLQELSLKHRD